MPDEWPRVPDQHATIRLYEAGEGVPADAKAGHPRESLPFAQVSRERFGRRD